MRRQISTSFVLAWGLAAAGCGGHAKGPRPDGGASADAVSEPGPPDAADAGAPADAGVACPALGAPPAGPRASSLRAADCDFGEQPDFVNFDLFCPDGCPGPGPAGRPALSSRVRRRAVRRGRALRETSRLRERHAQPVRQPVHVRGGRLRSRGGVLVRGRLAPWEADAPLPIDLYYHAAAAGSGRVFVSGGLTIDRVWSGSGASLKAVDQVLGATLDGGGRVTAWTAVGTLPAPLYFHAMAVAAGRLYVSGGGQRTLDASVRSAEILPDGTLGPWRAEAPMPTGRGWHRLLASGDTSSSPAARRARTPSRKARPGSRWLRSARAASSAPGQRASRRRPCSMTAARASRAAGSTCWGRTASCVRRRCPRSTLGARSRPGAPPAPRSRGRRRPTPTWVR